MEIVQRVTAKDRTLSRDPESAVESAGDGTRGIGGRLRMLNPSLAALITWLVCLPVAFAAATLGPADPFRLRVAMVPVVVAVAGVIVAGVASRRLPGGPGQRHRGRAVRRMDGVHAADGPARHALRI